MRPTSSLGKQEQAIRMPIPQCQQDPGGENNRAASLWCGVLAARFSCISIHELINQKNIALMRGARGEVFVYFNTWTKQSMQHRFDAGCPMQLEVALTVVQAMVVPRLHPTAAGARIDKTCHAIHGPSFPSSV
jgi:hypothetical protein